MPRLQIEQGMIKDYSQSSLEDDQLSENQPLRLLWRFSYRSTYSAIKIMSYTYKPEWLTAKFCTIVTFSFLGTNSMWNELATITKIKKNFCGQIV